MTEWSHGCAGRVKRDISCAFVAFSGYNESALTLSAAITDAVRAYQSALSREFPSRLVRTVVFGSVARGEATEDSDIDILVLFDRLNSRERARAIDLGTEVAFDRRMLFSPLPLSVDEWHDLEMRERLLTAEIAREGIQI